MFTVFTSLFSLWSLVSRHQLFHPALPGRAVSLLVSLGQQFDRVFHAADGVFRTDTHGGGGGVFVDFWVRVWRVHGV